MSSLKTGRRLSEKDGLADKFTEDDASVSFAMTRSYDSISSYDCASNSYSNSYHSDMDTPLMENKCINTFTNAKKTRLRSYTVSVIDATYSLTKLTTSNFFGFSGAAYAAAQQRHIETFKTISLPDIVSLDRFTPTIVAFFTTLSMLTGLSIFVFPSLVAHCGLYILPLLVTIATVSCYTSHLVHKCQHQTSKNGFAKRVHENYIGLGKTCIKWHGEGLMKLLVGSSVFTDIYSLVFCAQISQDLLNCYIVLGKDVWMVIWVGLIFPMFFIRRMSVLVWFGFVALILYLSGSCFVYVLLIWHHDKWSWKNLNPEFDVKYFFVGYGVIINTYNLHLAVPAIEASMREPKSFPTINIIAFVSNTLLKLFLAVAGAVTFGAVTQSSLLTNLVPFGVYAGVANVLIGLYMYTQYPTSMFVVFEMLDLYVLPKFLIFKKGEKSEWGWIILSRLFLSVFIGFVAICLPNFEMLTGFIGNVRGTLTVVILPIYFYLKIYKRRLSKGSVVFHWLMIVVSSLFAITGAAFCAIGMLS